MNGMGMFLDALGVNPQEIKTFVDRLPVQVKKLQESYNSIEVKLDRILAILELGDTSTEGIWATPRGERQNAGINGSGNTDSGN